ncbi:MAG TPA: glycogen debranching N-terminal domain-containing protein [Candidatus Dormibacteraeota bacterium]|nr:glycogen debranching N-terminal domain-containing protein [Candidatus Dormibacteraeota bacterium]
MISAGQLISERVMLKRDRFFAVSARDGSMRPSEFVGDGLWDGDTRILSAFRVLIDGIEATGNGLRTDDAVATFDAEAGPLQVTRTRFVEGGLHERITVTNTSAATVDAVLEVSVEADFAAMLGIRGAVPQLSQPTAAPAVKTVEGVRFESPAGRARVIAFPEGLVHQLRLGPGDDFSVRVDVVPDNDEPVVDFVAGLEESRDLYQRWAADCMSVVTDNPALNALLAQATADIRMLMNRYDTGLYPTGGLPWYAVPFGRDTLISSILLLHVNPDIARGVLRYQAAHQGKRVDANSQEEPGKILHEVRNGEAVKRGLWPHILYTTVDATALFLCALTETESWTHDHRLADELWPAAEAALEWCKRYGDVDGDGYIEDRGIRYRNAGWKDSADSLTNVDGTDVLRPVALCEVQAYLHRGLVGMSRRRPALKEQAAGLKWRFNRDFWMPKEKFFAQALDGTKRQVRAVSSNPGHCLWMRIIDRPKAAQVAQRLMAPDLFSGWGIRTLSERAVNYDACSYHNGSVWPFDTALAVAGLRQYGYAAESERLARALIEASIGFPMHRPPELFCGDVREPGGSPKEYWNTCTPQLWSAAAMFTCVASILGLEADPRRKSLRVSPVKTELWSRIEVTGLHFAGQRVDFVVDGTELKSPRVQGGVRIN